MYHKTENFFTSSKPAGDLNRLFKRQLGGAYAFSDLVNIPSVEMDKKIENEIAVMLGLLRVLGKRKQFIFLSAAKVLLGEIEKS